MHSWLEDNRPEAAPAARRRGQGRRRAGRDRGRRARPRALPRCLHRHRAGGRPRPMDRAALLGRGARAAAAGPRRRRFQVGRRHPRPCRAAPGRKRGLPRGTLHVLFDADEHTGRFGGVRAYLESIARPPDAVSLGYPGNDCIVVGSRGFLRAKLHFSGKAAHSGEVERTGINALTKAAAFALKVADAAFPETHDAAFPFGPAATVTRLEGGEGFSVVPDHAVCHIDIRLTRAFDGTQGRALAGGDRARGRSPRPHRNGRPLAGLSRRAGPRAGPQFRAAAERAFGRPIATDVCGPSNIGNLLAARACRRSARPASASPTCMRPTNGPTSTRSRRSTRCIATRPLRFLAPVSPGTSRACAFRGSSRGPRRLRPAGGRGHARRSGRAVRRRR